LSGPPSTKDNGATQYAHLITQGIRVLNIRPLADHVVDTSRW
jgi:hypothetical protein